MSARDEFLAKRRLGIGGSDAAAALGLSPWTSPLELYREKRGEAPARDATAAMEWGELIEPAIIEAYRRKTGRVVKTGEQLRGLVSSRHPFMRCNLDGLVHNGDVNAPGIIVEAKLSSLEDDWGEPGTDQVPAHYIPQAQHCMAVTGFDVVDFAVLFVRFGVKELQTFTVPRDEELIAMLIERERELWQRILDGNPPDPTTPEEIRLRWPSDIGTSKEAELVIVAAVDLLAQAKAEKKAAEAKEKEYAAVVTTFMQDAAALTYQGRTLATWKQNRDTAYFDSDALAIAHPAIFAQFHRTRPGNRPLLIKKG